MPDIQQTTRQDLPESSQPVGFQGLEALMNMLFKDVHWVKDPTSPFKNKTKPVSGDSNDLIPNSYEEMGGPLQPGLEGFNNTEQAGRNLAVDKMKSGQPIEDAADQWMLDQFGTGDPNTVDTNSDIAKMTNIFTMGGPVGGATRTGLMDMLMGPNQKYAQQSLLDTLYGKNAKGAQDDLAGYLGPQSDTATDAAFNTIGGDLAGDARGSARDTIAGKYLTPDTNPYLKATGDAALKATADAFKYGTAPEMAGSFARSGTFGGSAHQQTMGMKQFDLAKALADQSNALYGANYAQERDRQLGQTSGERGYTQSALEGERGREYGAMDSSLARAIQAALDERGGERGLLDSSATRQLQASEGELNRGVTSMGMLPDLLKSRYNDADVLRGLGIEQRQIDDANNRIGYENDVTNFQFPFNLMNIFGQGLASFTGGQGVSTTTSPNPNATSPVATGVGGTLAGVGALSGINDIGRSNGWWGTPDPTAAAKG